MYQILVSFSVFILWQMYVFVLGDDKVSIFEFIKTFQKYLKLVTIL